MAPLALLLANQACLLTAIVAVLYYVKVYTLFVELKDETQKEKHAQAASLMSPINDQVSSRVVSPAGVSLTGSVGRVIQIIQQFVSAGLVGQIFAAIR